MARTTSWSRDWGALLVTARQAVTLGPGLAVALAIAVAARMLSAISPIPAVFAALVLGIAVASRVATPTLEAGLAVGGRGVLRAGVALLGVQVTLADIAAMGLPPFFFATVSVVVTLGLGYPLGRIIGLQPRQAILAAGGVAICGASAVLAISAVLPKHSAGDEQVAATVAGVTILGSIGMLAYPIAALALGLSPQASGIFLGASLHEVVQAVGAGFSLSDQIGEIATAVKLIRVALLAPVVILIACIAHSRASPGSNTSARVLPPFLVAFILIALLSSFHFIPPWLAALVSEASRWCLLVGIAALGAKLSLPQLRAIGMVPVLALSLQSCIIAGVTLGAIILLGTG